MFEAETHELAFGDYVKIRTTSETKHLKLEGMIGEIFGMSDPTTSGVEVVGQHKDIVFAVTYDEDTYWVRPELIEFVERPEITMTIGNITRSRDANGNWTGSRKPWWRFW